MGDLGINFEEEVRKRMKKDFDSDEYLRIGELSENGGGYKQILAENKFQKWKDEFWKSFRIYTQYRNVDFSDRDYNASYWDASYNEEQIKFEDAENGLCRMLRVALHENKEEYIFEIMRALSENVVTCDSNKYYKNDVIFGALMQMSGESVTKAFCEYENELKTKTPFWHDKMKEELLKSEYKK